MDLLKVRVVARENLLQQTGHGIGSEKRRRDMHFKTSFVVKICKKTSETLHYKQKKHQIGQHRMSKGVPFDKSIADMHLFATFGDEQRERTGTHAFA